MIFNNEINRKIKSVINKKNTKIKKNIDNKNISLKHCPSTDILGFKNINNFKLLQNNYIIIINKFTN